MEQRAAGLLDTSGAAKYLGVAPGTLENWRCLGGGPAYFKVGRRCLYSSIDLDAWLSERRRTSTSEAA